MDFKLKYLHKTTSRGEPYYYYRRGKKPNQQNVRIDAAFGSAEFLKIYSRIHSSFESETPKAGTLDFLCEKYLASIDYKRLKASSRKNIGPRVQKLRKVLGKTHITEIRAPWVKALQAEYHATPGKANAYTQLIGQLLNFAVSEEMIPFNPIAKKIKPLKMGEYQPWPQSAMDAFLKLAGRTPKLAFYLALYTGQREADVVAMRWSDIHDNMIRVKPQKTETTTEVELYIPIHPKLAPVLKAAKQASKGLTILQQRNGRPYTINGFKMVWHQDKGRVKGFVFHGLRKNATVALAEAGCSDHEIQAITGHATLAMIQHYSKGVNQKRLAKQAMDKWK